ncbi:MAG: pyridoxal-phosphate dependent enzyme [Candidatus Latescibacteria bacterium]|nr:pyridoxal-phosphate dependent enzyme [Candidatus Latescibacterota bacterium]
MQTPFLRCTACDRTYALADPVWRCACGGLLGAVSDPRFDRDGRRPPTLWRYREAMAVLGEPVSFGEGMTPLVQVQDTRAGVFYKLDYLFPSGSFKDRGATAMITHLRSIGIRQVVEDSSGNAGAAVAAYCARAGIACDIYAPAHASPGKLAQIAACGATLHPIRGTREDVAAAAMEAAGASYYASHSWNPFFFQGTKTVAFEVCEQLGWRAPDALVLPAGNGTLLLGAHLGFSDLRAGGVIDRLPRLVAAQAEACAPVCEAFRQGLELPVKVQKRETLAEGIAVAEPVRGGQMLRAVRETGGEMLTVSEEETMRALRRAWRAGVYIEPTSAVALAATERWLDGNPGGTVVVVLTGSGLKATEKIVELMSA